MKKSLYILLLIGTFYSCVKDESSLVFPEDNPNFSLIEISSTQKELSVEFGQPLEFTPMVQQRIPEKTLSYEWVAWHIDDKGIQEEPIIVGTEKVLNYTFLEKGAYKLRLEAKNEDYSVFEYWDVIVRLYDEGYMIVGENEAGDSNIAFARKLSESDILNGLEQTFITDLIQEINPDVQIQDVVYVGKSILSYGSTDAYLFIFTKDYIHIADFLSFQIINSISVDAASPGTRIAKVSMLDTYASSAIILTEEGKILQFNKFEFNLYESDYYKGTYNNMYTNLFYTTGVNQNLSQIFVNDTQSKLYEYIPYHGSGALVNNTTGSSAPYSDNSKTNEYEGRDIVSVGRMNGDYFEGTNSNFFAIATDKSNPLEVKIVEFTTSYATGFETLSVTNYTAANPITLPSNQSLVANSRFNAMYYHNGNQIFVWNPLNIPPNNHLPTNASITLDGNKEVTAMAISYDMHELYVGFYDHDAAGALKGGMYVYECADIGIVSNLQPIKSFENITTRPKQVLYKTKSWGQYNSGS